MLLHKEKHLPERVDIGSSLRVDHSARNGICSPSLNPDAPAYAIVGWQHTVRGVNVIGLKRAGFDRETIRQLKEAFRILFRTGGNLSFPINEMGTGGKLPCAGAPG